MRWVWLLLMILGLVLVGAIPSVDAKSSKSLAPEQASCLSYVPQELMYDFVSRGSVSFDYCGPTDVPARFLLTSTTDRPHRLTVTAPNGEVRTAEYIDGLWQEVYLTLDYATFEQGIWTVDIRSLGKGGTGFRLWVWID